LIYVDAVRDVNVTRLDNTTDINDDDASLHFVYCAPPEINNNKFCVLLCAFVYGYFECYFCMYITPLDVDS